MNIPYSFLFPLATAVQAAALCGLLLGSGGCRKKVQVEAEDAAPPVVTRVLELESNGLTGLPGAIYRHQAASPIHWQPWTQETLTHAKTANRLVFGVIAMPQHQFKLRARLDRWRRLARNEPADGRSLRGN